MYERQMEDAFALCQKLGIRAVKTGYVAWGQGIEWTDADAGSISTRPWSMSTADSASPQGTGTFCITRPVLHFKRWLCCGTDDAAQSRHGLPEQIRVKMGKWCAWGGRMTHVEVEVVAEFHCRGYADVVIIEPSLALHFVELRSKRKT